MKKLVEALETYGALNNIEKPLLVSALLLQLKGKGSSLSNAQQNILTRSNLNIIVPALAKSPIEYFSELLLKVTCDDVISELYGGDYSFTGSDGHNLGIVLTPEHICELCCELLGLKNGDFVFEPCCGTGRFLVKAMNFVGDNVFGIELQEDLFTLARSNILIHGGSKSKIFHGDFFSKNLYEQEFSAGFINPPYSQKVSELEFIARLLDVLKVGGRTIAVVPVSTMIGKTKKDKNIKAEILKRHTLEGVITLNKNTFYGVGTVPCIAMFTAGIPHQPEHEAKFINFEDDGYEVKKHVGLVPNNTASEKRKFLLECWRGERSDSRTKFMVKSTVEPEDEWCHSFYYYNDEIPKEEDFMKSLEDYLTFEANMIFHGRGYLFDRKELKPCPFCGSQNVEYQFKQGRNFCALAVCHDCLMQSGITLDGSENWTEKSAYDVLLEHWNRRSLYGGFQLEKL